MRRAPLRSLSLVALAFASVIGCRRKASDSAKAVAEDEGRDKARTCALPA